MNNRMEMLTTGNSGAPYYFDYANIITGIGDKPSAVHVHDNRAAYFFKRHLIQRAMSPFVYTLPENWDHDYFLYVLYCWGFVGVFDSGKYGVIPQGCSLKGYNVFYRPTEILVANPLLNRDREYKIGTNCEVVKLTPDYFGIMDLVEYYGNLLAVTYEAMAMNVQNSKLAYVFATGSKKSAESLKKIFDNIQGGDLAAFYDKDLDTATGQKAWEVFTNNLSNNYIADDLMETMRDIYNMFDTEIGINNNNMAKKKERVTVSEVESNNDETYSKVQLWFDTVSDGLEKVNKMFYNGDEKCKVEWRGGDPYAENDNNSDEYVPGGQQSI